MKGLNKFLKNKNTVTILGIILILFLLYFGYNATIQSTVNPIKVPVAKEKILPGTRINADKIVYKNVSKIVVEDNVVTNAGNIVGKYTNVNVTIPAGSMFYKELLVDAENLPGQWLSNIKFTEGEEAIYYGVDIASTFGNSILPDSYIDIYMQAYDENNNTIYGKLFSNIKVLAVHDSAGKSVFADSENSLTPAYLGFAMSHDNYNLLKRAKYLSEKGVELVVQPQGKKEENKNGAIVNSATLRDYINKNTKSVTDDQIDQALANDNNSNNSESNKNINSLLG